MTWWDEMWAPYLGEQTTNNEGKDDGMAYKKQEEAPPTKKGYQLSIYWTPEVRRRLWAIITNLNTEVGGFGYAALEDGGESLTWYDAFLVPQEAGYSDVDYDGAGLQYAIDRAAEDGVLGKPDHVWVSWHSHNSMNVFWSATDEDCIDTYGHAGMPVLLSLVGNHRREYKARLDFFDVKHHGLTIPKVTVEDLTIDLDEPEPVDPFEEAIKQEIKEYVQPRTWRGPGFTNNGASPASTTSTSSKGPKKGEQKEPPKTSSSTELERLSSSNGPELSDEPELPVGVDGLDGMSVGDLVSLGMDVHEIRNSDRYMIADGRVIDLGEIEDVKFVEENRGGRQ